MNARGKITFRPFRTLLCLLTLTLTGCPGGQIAPDTETGVAPDLVELHSDKMFAGDFLEFSEDGSTFAASSKYNGVARYRASDHALLERYYARNASAPRWPGDHDGPPTGEIVGIGYIDANTWYFIAMTTDRGKSPVKYREAMHFRTINPPREIAAHGTESCTPVSVNKNYIACDGEMVNWRTGERYEVSYIDTIYMGGFLVSYAYLPHYALTTSGRVISYDAREGFILVDDPINKKTERWKAAPTLVGNIVVTPDERHAIVAVKDRCRLWKLPEKKEIGRCIGRGHEIAVSPDNQTVAITQDNVVQVYRFEPFQVLLEKTMPAVISALALSDDGWLAVGDKSGLLRVWDVSAGKLAGKYDFASRGQYSTNRLSLQPGGNKLLASHGLGFSVFALPARAAR